MKALKIIGFTLLSIIGIIVFGIVVGLGIILVHTFLQWLLFGRGDYLLGVSKGPNLMAISMLSIIVMYSAYRGVLKFYGRKLPQVDDYDTGAEEENAEPHSKLEKYTFKLFSTISSMGSPHSKLRMSNIIRFFCVPVLAIALYFGIADYSILYTDSVKVSTPWNPTGVVYKYHNIESIDVRIDDNGKNAYSPSYSIVFDDGKSVDLMGDTLFGGNGEDFEEILCDFDEKLRIQGVDKTVDAANFEKYAQGLDKNFTSKIKKLFVN